MNIEEAIKNMDGLVVFIKMYKDSVSPAELPSLLLSFPKDVGIEIDKAKKMLFIDMNPVLHSKIGIRLEKIEPMKWLGLVPPEYFDIKNMKITPDAAFSATLDDRQITFLIQSKVPQDIETMKKEMHKEINGILNPVNKES